MLRTVLKSLFFLCIFVGIVLGAGLFFAYQQLILRAPASEMDPSQIERILGRESPVFYRDGQQRVGVFFDAQHRRYVAYEQIPPTFVNAIIAAEDSRFFSHFGLDVVGIGRAALVNFKAGRVVQGGSTITQQTAKNLFKRESRSFRAKLKELLYALRLEHYYSKKKILEFYANQFYVSGNGHGLGVAAKYYFDKEPAELSLLECAFIAGSVQRPGACNPFIKKTEAAQQQARKTAHIRAHYALDKMLGLGMIDDAAHRQAKEQELEFRQGKTVYDTNIVMDLVREGLGAPVVEEALEQHGIDNVATAGLRIFTTVDRQLHETALRALRQELSRLDVRLDGYVREAVQGQYAELDYAGDPEILPGAFVFGTVQSITGSGGAAPLVTVDLGEKRGQGIIERKGLAELTDAYAKWRRQRWSTATATDQAELLAQLHPGDRVWVSVLAVNDDGRVELELEKYPRLQGGAMVMRQGEILAMAGGSANRFFNRAVAAKRTMGSTFKTLLMGAALELGWSSTDLLDNRRNVFAYQGRPYYPRPDHQSPHEQVSLAWTGVHSENLAAVWLLYHLLDHLTPAQFRDVAAHLDLTPRQGKTGSESPRAFAVRIRDQHGILTHREILEEAAYHQALLTLEADFLFDDGMEEYRRLRSLPYGRGHEGYLRQVSEQLAHEKDAKERAELALRNGLLYKNYKHLREVGRAADAWRQMWDGTGAVGAAGEDAVRLRASGMFWLDGAGRYCFSLHGQPPAGTTVISPEDIASRLAFADLAAIRSFWLDLRLDGWLPFAMYQNLEAQQARELARLISLPPYSMEVLETLHDYRLLVTLRYLIALGHQLGIASPLEPVLSFPLGSNVVSLFETVRMYEGLITGRGYGVSRNGDRPDAAEDGLAIIERIESAEGAVLYRRRPADTRLVADAVSMELRDILHNVVQHGTGRLAREKVVMPQLTTGGVPAKRPTSVTIPLFGKTGTANRYINASFVGFVPGLETSPETRLSLEAGTTIGVYVGFDDNQPMTRGSTRLAGAAGALPTWCELASSVLARFGEQELDEVDLAFNGLTLSEPQLGQLRLAVQLNQGGVVPPGEARTVEAGTAPASVLAFGQLSDSGDFQPERVFRPFWQEQEAARQ